MGFRSTLDFLLRPEFVQQAWNYFRTVQTKEAPYESFLAPDDKPAIEMNEEKMEKFAPQLKKFYYDLRATKSISSSSVSATPP